MSEFKILVDVELNTGGLQAELDKAAAGLKLKINNVEIASKELADLKRSVEAAIGDGMKNARNVDIDQRRLARQTGTAIVSGIKDAEKQSSRIITGFMNPKKSGSVIDSTDMDVRGYRPSKKWLDKTYDVASVKQAKEKIDSIMDGTLGVDRNLKRATTFKNLESMVKEYIGIEEQLAKLDSVPERMKTSKDKRRVKNLKEWNDNLYGQIMDIVNEANEKGFIEDEKGTRRVTKGMNLGERTHMNMMREYGKHRIDLAQATARDSFEKNLTNMNFNELQSKLRELNSTEVKLRGMDEMSSEADNARQRIALLRDETQKLMSENWDNFTYRQRDAVARLQEKSGRNIDATDARAATKEQEADLKERIKLQNKIAKARSDMRNLDEKNPIHDQLKQDIDKWKAQQKEIDSSYRWTNDQVAKIRNAADDNVDKGNAARAKQNAKVLNEIYKERLRLEKQIGDKKIKLLGLDESSEQARVLNKQLKELEFNASKLDSDNAFTRTQKDNISSAKDEQNNRIRTEEAKLFYKNMLAEEKAEIKAVENDIKSLKDSTRELANIRIKMIGLDEASNEFKELSASAKKAEADIASAKAKLEGRWDDNQKKDFDVYKSHQDDKEDIAHARYADKEYDDSTKRREQALKNLIQLEKDAGVERGRLTKATNDIDVEYSERRLRSIEQESDAIRKSYDLYDELLSDDEFAKISEAREEAIHREYKAINEVNELYVKTDANFRSKQESLSASLDLYREQNTKLFSSNSGKDFVKQFEAIESGVRNATSIDQLNNLSSSLTTFGKRVRTVGLDGLTVFDKLKNKIGEYGTYAVASFGVMELAQGLGAMARQVLEVDTAMTGLMRVTELTGSKYDELYSKMAESSGEYGRTLTDTINATADWVRAGFDAETALGIAEKTAMYQNVSDLDYDEAAKNMLTSYKGFEKYLNQKFNGDAVAANGHIIDVLNELDNKFSVTSAGLGEGLARSASALQVAGNTFEQSAAMVGAIAEVTQDPAKAGNALKTISMRLRGMKGELEELGEDSSGVENITKMQGKLLNLTKGKVNIFGDDGQFRSTFDILNDIAEVYDELDSKAQGDILETVAGKHRANDLAAYFSNYETGMAMEEAALNSAGSAAKENARQVDSLQGRINALTSAWQQFSNAAMNSDFLKTATSGLTGLLDVLTSVVDTFGTLPALMGLVGAALNFTDLKDILPVQLMDDASKRSGKRFTSPWLDVVKSLTYMKDIGNSTFSFTDRLITPTDINLIDNFNRSLETGQNKMAAYNELMLRGSQYAKQYGAELNTTGKHVDNVQASYEKYARKMDVAIQAQDHSFKNARNMLAGLQNADMRKGLSQKEYIGQVSGSWREMGIYMNNLAQSGNVANASMRGYIATLAATRVAMLGVQVAAMAMNAALTMGIGVLVSVGVSALMSFINRAEETANRVKEITTAYNEQKESLQSAKSAMDGYSESYAELSKGVNPLTNENLNLSTDQYEEYLGIVNQIADSFPSLVTGYDAQGNAILSCAGNLEDLNAAYEEAAGKSYDDVMSGANDIFDNFNDKYDDIRSNKTWGDSWLFDDGKMRMDSYDALKDVLETNDGSDIESKIDEYILSNEGTVDEIATALHDAGIESKPFEFTNDFIKRAIKENPQVAKQIVSDFESQMKEVSAEMQTLSEAYVGKSLLDNGYSKISDNVETMIQKAIPNLGIDYFSKFGDDAGKLYSSLDKMLSGFDSLNSDSKISLETYFDMQSKLNNDDVTVGEYVSNLEDVGNVIDSLDVDEEIKKALRISFNLDDNDVKKQYDQFVGMLKDQGGHAEEAAKGIADGLTKTELDAAIKLSAEGEIDLTKIDSTEAKARIEQEAKLLEAMNFTIDMEAEIKGFESLSSALAETKTATGLTSASIEALENRYGSLPLYDHARLFEETAHGIRLNAEAYNELENQLQADKMNEATEALDTLNGEYEEYTSQINAAKEAGDYTRVAELNAEREAIIEQINDTATLVSQLEGLNSQYSAWQRAESSGNERDMYENLITAREQIKDELSRGWVDQGTKEYLELLTGKELSTAGVDEAREAYNQLGKEIQNTGYTLNDFMTVDDEGKSTTQGLQNFLEASDIIGDAMGKDWVQRDENGNIISFDFGVDGAEEVAAAMGTTAEFVQIMERGLADAGFVVSLDGAMTKFADLKNEAQAANDVLKEMGATDYTFNFDNPGEEDITKMQELISNPDFWNADGTFNVEAEGAEEALSVVTALTARIDSLNNKYLKIDASTVSEEMQEPLGLLQDYELAMNKKHQLQITGADTSGIDAEMDGIAEKLYNLDPKIKAQLDIENLTPEQIEEKITSGEITIPGVVDLQVKMADNLEILAAKALKDSGLITQEEFETRVKVAMSADVDNSSAKEDIEQASQETADGVNPPDVTAEQNVNVEGGEVDTSGVEETVSEATSEAGDAGAEPVKTTQDVKVEAGDIDTSDVFKGVDKKIELLRNATGKKSNAKIDIKIGDNKIDVDMGDSIESISEFVEVAKSLSGIDDYIDKTLVATFVSNLDDSDKIDNLLIYAEAAHSLQGVPSHTEANLTAMLDSNVWGEKEKQLANMEEYAEAAHSLQGVGNVTASVNAYMDSNVWGEKQTQLANMPKFAEAAHSLQGVGNVTASVNAYMDSNVWGEKQTQLANMPKFAEAAHSLQGVGNVTASLSANITNVADQASIDRIYSFIDAARTLQGVSDVGVSVTADVGEVFSGKVSIEPDLSGLNTDLGNMFTATASVTPDFGEGGTDLGNKFTATASVTPDFGEGGTDLGNKFTATASVTPDFGEGGTDLGNMFTATASVQGRPANTVTFAGNANVKGRPVNTVTFAGNANVKGRPVNTVTFAGNANVKGRPANTVTFAGNANVKGHPMNTVRFEGWSWVYGFPMNTVRFEGWSWVYGFPMNTVRFEGVADVKGTAVVNGTANSNGTANVGGAAFADGTTGNAFRKGNWGTKDSGTALMGELGQELIVRDGRFFTVGDHGAGFFKYKKGDIIFNHKLLWCYLVINSFKSI